MPATVPMASGLPGYDRDTPEIERAAGGDRILHMIGLADARTPPEVTMGSRAPAASGRWRSSSAGSSRRMREIGRVGPGAGQQSAQHGPVGVVRSSRGRERLAQLGPFIAGREQCDARPAAPGDVVQPQRGEQTEILQAEAMSGRQRDRSSRDILPGQA